MSELSEKKCQPCEGGVQPYSAADAQQNLRKLATGWKLSSDSKALQREFKFKDFFRTMSFVNALAHIANIEDHHPDLEVGYDHCRVRWSTHAVGGLSENDFICAAKVDEIGLS